ncbi:hypothetical protein IJ531_00975, partial [bacterium]|nr:hypothetical protein [bacterium]
LKYLLIIIPNALVYLINPWGMEFVKFMIDAVLYTDRGWVGEWQSPFDKRVGFLGKYIFILALTGGLYCYNLIKNKIKLKNIDYTKLLVLFITLIPALTYIKFRTQFVLTAIIFLYPEFKQLTDDITSRIKFRIPVGIIAILASVIYSTYIFCNYSPKNNWYLHLKQEMPLTCLQFLIDNNIKGNVFAPFNFGGFIAYKNYPDLMIYIDGRHEQVYDYEILLKHMYFLNMTTYDAPNVFMEYPTDIIIMQDFWACNMFLNNQSYFKKVFQHSGFSVYLAPRVQRFSYTYPIEAKDYTIDKIFKSRFN